MKKLIFLLAFFAFVSFDGEAQKAKMKKHAYHVHEHVWVTLRDGSEVECIIHGHVGRKKYWVRQFHTGHQGKVHEKFIRPMSDEEKANLKKKD